MERVSVKGALTTRSFSERTLSNGILRAFLYGIKDSEVRKKAARGLASREASPKSLHLAAKGANQAQQEVKKLEEEHARV